MPRHNPQLGSPSPWAAAAVLLLIPAAMALTGCEKTIHRPDSDNYYLSTPATPEGVKFTGADSIYRKPDSK